MKVNVELDQDKQFTAVDKKIQMWSKLLINESKYYFCKAVTVNP